MTRRLDLVESSVVEIVSPGARLKCLSEGESNTTENNRQHYFEEV